MKPQIFVPPVIFVPPAQAEALFDTQDELHPGEALARQPWRDEDAWDELLPYRECGELSGSNAQLWPSSVNSSR